MGYGKKTQHQERDINISDLLLQIRYISVRLKATPRKINKHRKQTPKLDGLIRNLNK